MTTPAVGTYTQTGFVLPYKASAFLKTDDQVHVGQANQLRRLPHAELKP